MGTESLTPPPIPDLSIIAEVMGLADSCEAERYAQRPMEYRGDDLDRYVQPRPRRDALVAHLLSLEAETVAALYSIYGAANIPPPPPARRWTGTAATSSSRWSRCTSSTGPPTFQPRARSRTG